MISNKYAGDPQQARASVRTPTSKSFLAAAAIVRGFIYTLPVEYIFRLLLLNALLIQMVNKEKALYVCVVYIA